MNIWTNPARFKKVVTVSDANYNQSGFNPTDYQTVHYFWPNDALPEGWPGRRQVRSYLFDGTTFTPESEHQGFQGLLAEDTRRDLIVRIPFVLSPIPHGPLLSGTAPVIPSCHSSARCGFALLTTATLLITRCTPANGCSVMPTLTAAHGWTLETKSATGWLRRYETLKAAAMALDLTDPSQRVLINDFAATYRQDHWWDDGALVLPDGWPVYEVPEADLAKWSDATTVHDVDRQAEHELETIYGGSLIPALLTAMLRADPASPARRHGQPQVWRPTGSDAAAPRTLPTRTYGVTTSVSPSPPRLPTTRTRVGPSLRMVQTFSRHLLAPSFESFPSIRGPWCLVSLIPPMTQNAFLSLRRTAGRRAVSRF